jgi:2-polyprenyl-6-methoxyphenol hydroxylase-like FAD-dependent oxidoreductase
LDKIAWLGFWEQSELLYGDLCERWSIMEKVDIVIVGAGPCGLMLSTLLARWGYTIKHLDVRPEPTKTGRADGIQPRSLDLLRNMGLKSAIMAHDPARVYEVAFWDPAEGGIKRTGTWASCPAFIDTRFPFTTLLHQGYIERVFIDDLERNDVQIQRPWRISDFENDGVDSDFPVRVHLAHDEGHQEETIRTKYLFSAEGARSSIRKQLGVKFTYKDPVSHVWAVMDGEVSTDFPDIRMKCTIHSDQGSIMIIPREDNMVRLYIQIAECADQEDWHESQSITPEEAQDIAKRILSPYRIEWEHVEWFSIYPISQGIAERYTLDERIFLGGDACHTHSPKAGQGMNTAFLDALNLAWKIHHVESGFASRQLLETYESERKGVAEHLLEFDARYSNLFSQRESHSHSHDQPTAQSQTQVSSHGVGQAEQSTRDDRSSSTAASSAPPSPPPSSTNTPTKRRPSQEGNDFMETFKSSCEFTSGYGIVYPSNILNYPNQASAERLSKSSSFLFHGAGTSLRPGRIFPSAEVTRVRDANRVHLEQEIPSNGAWRLYIFAGEVESRVSSRFCPQALADLAAGLQAPGSFYQRAVRQEQERQRVRRRTPRSGSPVPEAKRRHVAKQLRDQTRFLPHTAFVSIATIFTAPRSELEICPELVPSPLLDYTDSIYADDDPSRGMGTDKSDVDASGSAHRKMGFDSASGGVVVVRPDGYVGCVLSLVPAKGHNRGTIDALESYFGAVMK